MGPFTQTRKGKRYLLVIVNFFTKWGEVAALPSQETRITANVIFSEWVTRYGTPDQIHSDQGPNFESRLFHELCEASGVKKTRTTPYHPQGNGQTERTNRSLLSLLKCFIDQAKHDCWDELLPQCLMVYRCTVHKSTGQSPALLMLGRELRLPFDINIPLSPTMELTHNAFVAQKIVL